MMFSLHINDGGFWMRINQKDYIASTIHYTIRSAVETDARALEKVRWQIDGETEYLDREQGEAYIDESEFRNLIQEDTNSERNLFLVAEVNGRIAGFSRCEGSQLKRFSHKVDFGICLLREFWGYGIGPNLLKESMEWADSCGLQKISLSVLESNEKAIRLYKKFGFKVEGILKMDKILSDGTFYNTVIMGRYKEIQ
jgi:ribosomal protein S18 acetylase RimI-like enzyme